MSPLAAGAGAEGVSFQQIIAVRLVHMALKKKIEKGKKGRTGPWLVEEKIASALHLPRWLEEDTTLERRRFQSFPDLLSRIRVTVFSRMTFLLRSITEEDLDPRCGDEEGSGERDEEDETVRQTRITAAQIKPMLRPLNSDLKR